MNDEPVDDDKPELIKPPSSLMDKVTIGGPGSIDLEDLERAEKVMQDLADDYLEWVAKDLINLRGEFEKLRDGEGDSVAGIDRIFQISHDIKGQGGSFNYDLMTFVGNQLCRFVEKIDKKKVGPLEFEVIDLHIASMQMVLAQKLTGDGGEIGAQLLSGLEKVIAKRAGA